MAVATIIGAAGRMGSWFADFLNSNDYSIIVCDRDELAARKLARKNGFSFEKDPTEAAKHGDVVLLTTPTPTTKKLLKRIAPHIPKTTLLVEISSVKHPLLATLEQLRKCGFSVLSIHPMFGHGAGRPTRRRVIIAQQPPNNRTATRFISTFKKTGVKIVHTDLANHDRMIAVTLALPHFMNFAMIDTMKTIGIKAGKARNFGGTTFNLQLIIAEALYHERLTNEASIVSDNPYSLEILDSFAKEVNRIRAAARQRGQTRLLHGLRGGAKYVHKDAMFPSAYDLFNAAVQAT